MDDHDNNIDAEIAAEGVWTASGKLKRDDRSSWSQDKRGARKSEGFLDRAKHTVSSLVGGLARRGPPKTEVYSPEEMERQRRREDLNGAIDTMFEGSGSQSSGPAGVIDRMLGGLMKGVVKQLSGRLVDAMGDLGDGVDTADVMREVVYVLEGSEEACALLGSRISLGNPLASSMSTTSINGEVNKAFSFILPVTGTSSIGQVEVTGSVDAKGRVQLPRLVVQTDRGERLTVDAGTHMRGSGRRSRRGGGSDSDSDRGVVIDAEVIP